MIVSNDALEMGQSFPDQCDIAVEEDEDITNLLMTPLLLGRSPVSDNDDIHFPEGFNNKTDKTVLANVITQNVESDRTSNWMSSMIHCKERNMSELSDISLWQSLQAYQRPLTEKQLNIEHNLVCSDKTTDSFVHNEQLFIRGANVILVRILSNT
ncbi:unnamed protein product [Heterobilharzia americana]|nr:unnamed protein product [Heterobilharzia americana]